MVKIDRTPTAPASLAIEKAKNGSYREHDVVNQLREDFHEKCYLCELRPSDRHVEHLVAHHGNLDLKFDWNNLFHSCPHCNGVKNQPKYERNVLDCCSVDPETVLHQALVDGRVIVTALIDTVEAETTAALLTDCFELRNTGIRIADCDFRVNELKLTMDQLYRTLARLKTAQVPEHSRSLCSLRGMLDRSYKFAGFTRTYVRQYLTENPELAALITL